MSGGGDGRPPSPSREAASRVVNGTGAGDGVGQPPGANPGEVRLLAGLAAAIVACFLLLSLAGGKEASAALSAPAPANTALLGLMWVAAHLGLVIVAPVLALASAVRLALERVTRRA